MSAAQTSLPEARATQLIQEIKAEVEADAQAIVDAADKSARRAVADAYAVGRQQLHEVVVGLRREAQRRHDLAQRQAEARALKQEQRRAAGFLAEAIPRLGEALVARWQEPVARGLWIATAARIAGARLATSNWTIDHPGDWTVSDSREFRSAVGLGDVTINEAVDPALTTGLRIKAGDAVVDATPTGLTVDAMSIMAMLLAEFTPPTIPDREHAP